MRQYIGTFKIVRKAVAALTTGATLSMVTLVAGPFAVPALASSSPTLTVTIVSESSCDFTVNVTWTPTGGKDRIFLGLGDNTTGHGLTVGSEVVHHSMSSFTASLTVTSGSYTDDFQGFAFLYDRTGTQLGYGQGTISEYDGCRIP